MSRRPAPLTASIGAADSARRDRMIVAPPSVAASSSAGATWMTGRMPLLAAVVVLAGAATSRAMAARAATPSTEVIGGHAATMATVAGSLGAPSLAHPVPADQAAQPHGDGPDQVTGPLPLSATQIHLPAMAIAGQAQCETRVEVQNAGSAPSKAILVVWSGSSPAACPPAAAGPHKVECTGLIRPGGTWNLGNNQLPAGSASGTLFSFMAAQFSDLGLPPPGGADDIVADYMCEQLFFGVVGDADDYRRFKRAFDEGTAYADVSLAAAAGAPLSVQVERRCLPSDAVGGMGSAYEGVPGSALGAPGTDGRYGYAVPFVAADADGRTTQLSIQNAGSGCASVDVWYVPSASADSPCDTPLRKCVTLTIAPGEADALNPARWCGRAGGAGSVWLASDGPLAVVADTTGPHEIASYAAQADGGPAAPAALAAPLIDPPVDAHGRRSFPRVHVQNLSPDRIAAVKLAAVDGAGAVAATAAADVCPRAATTFDVGALALPSGWSGAIRVESLAAGVEPARPLPIAAVVDLRGRMTDESPADSIQYPALPVVGGVGATDGAGLLAVPWVRKGRAAGDAAEIAIQNLVTVPGFTDFTLLIFDQNGLLDFTCQKLQAAQVERIDLQRWGHVNPGFTGSLVVSAVYWEHDVFDPNGTWVRNPVGLGAVVVERGPVAAAGAAGFGFRPGKGGPTIAPFGIGCPSGPLNPIRATPTPPALPPTIVPPRTPPADPSPTTMSATPTAGRSTPVPTAGPAHGWLLLPWVSTGDAP